MTPISKLIRHFENLTTIPVENPLLQEVRVVFLSPTLHIDLISNTFLGLTEEDRLDRIEAALADSLTLKTGFIYEVMSKLPVTISPLTADEAKNKASWLGTASTSSWVNWFLDKKPPVITRNIPNSPRYVHFYGYKGGQARSTILALLGKLLADDGYRILAIDADTEAPSLDNLLGTQADHFSQTLMGLCGWADEFIPIPAAYTGQLSAGRLDVLPCRPRNEDQDLDFALLVATAPLDTRIYERAAAKLRMELSTCSEPYDFVLIDHRTGIATSVLPLVSELPGPTVVFARTDANTASIPSEMRKVVRSIFGSAADNPGAFVSFSLDANRKSDGAVPPHEARIQEALLEELAQSIEAHVGTEQTEQISTQELAFNWINWYLDRALLDSTLPDISKLQSDNLASLQKLREVLGLSIHKKVPTISSSGAQDKGDFIHIPDVERLFVKGSPLIYILGRKGTGKTRLLREVALRKLGTPILVAADEKEFLALRSASLETKEWVKLSKDPDEFWWSLISFALQNINLQESISQAIINKKTPSELANPLEIKNILLQSTEQKVFLVDGLETLAPAKQTKEYVASLFSVMNTIQNDPLLSSKLVIRVFMREDLTTDSIQNIEQQMENRVLRLNWSATSILNFAVSRLPSLSWISTQFPTVSDEIKKRSIEIQKNSLSEPEATEILLRVFPERIKRNNLLTSTFLRLYFSDAGGDNTSMATFYPRLYLSFLQKLDELAQADIDPLSGEEPRLNSILLNRAYDQASTAFIDETKQELVHLLSLNFAKNTGESDSDQSKVTLFVGAFEGLSTPFDREKLISQLKEKTPFTEQSIRESLQRMKALRMFEERPGHAGWWRVGQLYKMGLRMKYAR